MAENALRTEIAGLQRQVEELREQLQQQQRATNKGRSKIEVMSGEVVDSNPYRYTHVPDARDTAPDQRGTDALLTLLPPTDSRLMALKRMGIVENYAVSRYGSHGAACRCCLC